MIKNAIVKTFDKRGTNILDIDNVIFEIKNADFIKELWNNYSNHYAYAKNIKFEEVVGAIEKLNLVIK